MADQEDSKYCSNCKRQIASVNFIMHEMHCRRNIVLCPTCIEPVPRSEMDSHFDEYHAKVLCSACKQQLEKFAVDDHKLECPKRSLSCEYCELDMPACDLKEHTDYCGTRTEPCPKCHQFIMQRDQGEHELSICMYPTKSSPVEPSGDGAAPGVRSDGGINNVDSFSTNPYALNPFAMNELSRIMHETSLAPSAMHNNVSATRESSFRSQIRPRPRLDNRNISRASKNTNESSSQARRANGNIRPPKNQVQTWTPSDAGNDPSNLDEVLARHLGADIFGNDPFGEAVSNPNIVNGQRDRSERISIENEEEDSEEISLPCEFCDELFPLEFFYEHQGSCNSQPHNNVNSLGDVSPRLSPSDVYPDHVLPNNSPRRNTTSNSQPLRPHIVDNLSMLAAQDWFSSPEAAAGGMEGEIMLPCEFCDKLFPDDLLVQHQAVCEASRDTPTHTHRSNTPHSVAAAKKSHNLKSNVIGAAGVEPSNNAIRSRVLYRQQSDNDTFNGLSDDLDFSITSSSSPIGATSGKVERSTWRRNGRRGVVRMSRDANRNTMAETEDTAITTTSSTRGRGLNGFTSSTSRYSHNRSGVRKSHQPSPNFDVTDLQRPLEVRRRSNTTHTNRTLDQLIKDPSSSTDELLAAMDKEEKSNRNQQTKDQTHTVQPGGEHSDLSLSGAVNGGKSRRSDLPQSRNDAEPLNRYDPSFGGTSRRVPRVGHKQRPVISRPAAYTGYSSVRLAKPQSLQTVTSSQSTDSSSLRQTNRTYTQRKPPNSRPRKAPQGEP